MTFDRRISCIRIITCPSPSFPRPVSDFGAMLLSRSLLPPRPRRACQSRSRLPLVQILCHSQNGVDSQRMGDDRRSVDVGGGKSSKEKAGRVATKGSRPRAVGLRLSLLPLSISYLSSACGDMSLIVSTLSHTVIILFTETCLELCWLIYILSESEVRPLSLTLPFYSTWTTKVRSEVSD